MTRDASQDIRTVGHTLHAAGSHVYTAIRGLDSAEWVVLACIFVTGLYFTILTKYLGDRMDALKAAVASLTAVTQKVQDTVTALKAAEASAPSPGDLAAVTQAVSDAVTKLTAAVS